jgi:hypothetical protein
MSQKILIGNSKYFHNYIIVMDKSRRNVERIIRWAYCKLK